METVDFLGSFIFFVILVSLIIIVGELYFNTSRTFVIYYDKMVISPRYVIEFQQIQTIDFFIQRMENGRIEYSLLVEHDSASNQIAIEDPIQTVLTALTQTNISDQLPNIIKTEKCFLDIQGDDGLYSIIERSQHGKLLNQQEMGLIYFIQFLKTHANKRII